MKRILIVGDVNVDLVLEGCRTAPLLGREVLAESFRMTLGGASAICAVGLARLGDPVAIRGVVGADLWGDYCVETMAAEGVDVSGISRHPSEKTGVTVSLSTRSDRALVTFPGTIDALRAAELPPDFFRGFDHLHISSYFLQKSLGAGEILARGKAGGLTTSLDPGFDPADEWAPGLRDVLTYVDVFFPNGVELSRLSRREDPAAGLRDLANGVTLTVVKLGEAGALALDGDRALAVPTYPVVARDTTGAGDSFDAGFLHAWLRGSSLQRCLQWGTAAGALSTRGPGGTSTQASGEEIERLVAGQP